MDARLARDFFGDAGGEGHAIHGQRMSGRNGALASDGEQQGSGAPHFLLKQPGSGILAVGFERIRAHQLGEVRRLVGGRGADRAHLEQLKIKPSPRALPCGLGPRQSRANDFDTGHTQLLRLLADAARLVNSLPPLQHVDEFLNFTRASLRLLNGLDAKQNGVPVGAVQRIKEFSRLRVRI